MRRGLRVGALRDVRVGDAAARGGRRVTPSAASSLHDGYGLTEAAPVVTLNASARGPPSPGRSGAPLPGVEVELRDADGERGRRRTIPGRIFVRGANLFSGYWPDGADGPDADGWFGTGDIAVADDDGDLHLVGRSTELVIVNGFNVYPAEVEAVLARYPASPRSRSSACRTRRPARPSSPTWSPRRGAELDADELLAAAAGSAWPGSSCRARIESSTRCRTRSPARS